MSNNLKEPNKKPCGCSDMKTNVIIREGLNSKIYESSCSTCMQVLAVDELVDEFAKEPTIDWLIDEICPNEGNSPLLSFNKERLKTLINQKEKEARIDELEKISGFSNATGVATVASGELGNLRNRIKQLKEELKGGEQ